MLAFRKIGSNIFEGNTIISLPAVSFGYLLQNSDLLSLDIKIPTLEILGILGMLLKWIRLFPTW
jgi:hypothetical protein